VINLTTVTEHIYRGGHPTVRDYDIVLPELGVRTIVDLCDDGHDLFSAQRQHYYEAKLRGLLDQYTYYRARMTLGDTSVAVLRSVLSLIIGAPKRVYVHCARGIDRTGYVIAAYRILHLGWSVEDALLERTSYQLLNIPQYNEALKVVKGKI